MKLIPEGAILNNRYKVGELLGEGGTAAVYEAQDVELGITVALKVLKDGPTCNKEQIEMLSREAEAMRGLHHPNIVKVYGIGHFEGIHYIAMEKIDGVTLDELIAQGGALQWTDCVEIIKQVLAALCYTHYHGVIHKDIKPQNILVDQNKHATLTDFGIAAQKKKSQSAVVTADGACSVYYMSPEQVSFGIADKRSDIYSLGITFYEMLVGATPFDGNSDLDIALMHTKGTIIPACIVDESIPRAISDIVVAATLRDPNKRFQTAEEMLEALLRAEKNPNDIIVSAQAMVNEDIISVDSSLAKKENVTKKTKPENVANVNKKDNIVKERKKRRGLTPGEKILIAITYIIAILISGVIVISFVGYYNETMKEKSDVLAEKIYVIEDYSGYVAEDVIKLLKDNSIQCDVKTVVSDLYPSGYILTQSVLPGTELKNGDRISISVIASEGSIVMEDFTGKNISNVKQILENSDIKVREVTVSSSLGTGVVIKTIPYAGNSIEKGSTITVYVSNGKMGELVILPDLTNNGEGLYSLEEAKAFLESMGLKLGGVYPEPGTDLDLYFATSVPVETPTVEPTQTAEATFDQSEMPFESPLPSEIVTETISPSETPVISTFPTFETFGTYIPEPTQSPNPYLAGLYVIEQYPSAGTSVLKGSYVDLYFYNKRILNNISLPVIYEIQRPSGASIGNIIPLIKFVFELSNGDVREVTYTNVDVNEFPLKVSVPFAWGSYSTKMIMYVNETENIYKTQYVYRTDEEMVPTPIPTAIPTDEPLDTPSPTIEIVETPTENGSPLPSETITETPINTPMPSLQGD